MKLSRGAKPILLVLIGLYILVIVGIVYKAVTRPEPENKDAIVQALIATAKANDAKLTKPEAEVIYDTHLAEKGAIIAFNYTLVLQILNFSVLLVLLYGLLWGPLLKFLDERRDRVRSDLDAARQSREESGRDRGEAAGILGNARRERMRIRELADREAEQNRQEILKKAREEAERLVQSARDEIAGEIEKARVSLRAEVADIAVAIAAQILEREINKADQEILIQELMRQVESRKAE